MHRLFHDLVSRNTVQANPDIMNGLACIHMENTEAYVNRIFQLVSKTYPRGLTYDGYERCSPYEEFEDATKVRSNQRNYDLAPSSIYLVKYKFSFNENPDDPNSESIPLEDRCIYLPFVEDGGIIMLGGVKYHITPVLSDKVISPGHDSIFVRTLQKKETFKRCSHTIVLNGRRESHYVIWAQIYKKKANDNKVPSTTRAVTCLSHYLFCAYGVIETFEKFAGFTPIIGEEEINPKEYPESDWVVCQSAYGEDINIKPKSCLDSFYKGTKIRVVIPRNKWNDLTQALVLGLYYTIDHFPSRLKPSYFNNTDLWKILLGHILYSGVYGEDKLHTMMLEHFSYLDNCLDELTIEKLKERNYHVEDFYSMLALIMSEFNNLVLDINNTSTSMYNKNFEILYYILYTISTGLVTTMMNLAKAAVKKKLTAKDVTQKFRTHLTPRSIFKLTDNNVICEGVAYSGDHKYIKITSKNTEQERLPGGTRGASDESGVDVSMTEGGSMLFITKNAISPTSRINPYVCLDKDRSTVLPNPKFEQSRKITEEKLRNKIS